MGDYNYLFKRLGLFSYISYNIYLHYYKVPYTIVYYMYSIQRRSVAFCKVYHCTWAARASLPCPS